MDLLNQLQELLPKFKHYFAPASPNTNDEIRPPEAQPLLTVRRPDSRKGSQGEKFDPQKEQILFDEGSGSVDDDLQKLSAAVGKAMESFPDSDIAVDKGNMTDILEQEEMLPVTSATIITSDLTTSKLIKDITIQTKPTEHVMETTAEVTDERVEPTTQDEKLPTVSSTMDKTDDGLKPNGTAIHYESAMETTSADPDNVETRSVPTEELDNEGTVEENEFSFPTKSMEQETDGMKGSPHPTTSMEQDTDGGSPHPTTSMEQGTDGGFPHPTTSMEQETDGGSPHQTTSMEQETDGGSPHPTTSMEQETDGGSPHQTTSMEQDTDGGSPHPTTSMEQETDGEFPHSTTSMEQGTDGGSPHPTTSMEQETDGEFPHPTTSMEQETDGMKGSPHPTTSMEQETDGGSPHPSTSMEQETDGVKGSPNPTTSMDQETDGEFPHPTTSMEQETDGMKGSPHPTTSMEQETDGGSPHPTTSVEQGTDGGSPHPTTSMEQGTDGGSPHPTTSMEQGTDGGSPHPTTSMEQETDGGSRHPTTSMEQGTDGGSPHPTTSMEQGTDGGSPHPTTSMEQGTDGGSPHPTTSMEQGTDGGSPHPTTSMEQETDGVKGFPYPTTSMEKETVEGKGSSLPSTSIEQETEKEHFEEELYPTMESSYTTEMDFSSGPNDGVNMRLNDKTTGGELKGTESTGGLKYPTEAEKVVEKQRIEEDLKARIGNEDPENEKDRNEERKMMDDRERIDMEQDGDTSPSEYQTRSQEYSVPPTSGFSGYLTTPDRSDYKQPDLSGPGGANLGDTFTSREDDYGGRGPRDEPEVPTMPAATPSEVDPRETIMTTRKRLNLYQLTRPGGRATDAPRVVRGERFWTSRESIFPFICLPRGIIRGPTLCR